ncbi:MAG: hypothetical protein OZSIB_2803 [Candidatus Ozemobacter sibiricus]|uniref:NolW-like domain-containing protein n=1 Tax=Candidatus Ozemobacter sibiricus TaxID=2268124 RepID=A0A367ZRZ6_9BACT|nr:MAG: hypothetical protein OZSIB_2803 [Candidatus Ozemobacter sibiricus]
MSKIRSLLVLVLLSTWPALVGAADLNARISLDFRDADIRDLFKIAAEKGGFGLVVDKNVRGTITLRLLDVPLIKAFDTVAMAAGYEWYLVNDNIVLTDAARLPVSSTVRPLAHLAAAEAARILLQTLKKDIRIATTETGNALVMTARQPTLKEAERILAGLDQPRRSFTLTLQVMEGGKPSQTIESKGRPGSPIKFQQGRQILSPGGADQPPRPHEVGLCGVVETADRPGSDRLEGRIDLDLTWLETTDGPLPLLGRQKLETSWQAAPGKTVKIGSLGGGQRDILLTFTWDS